MSDEMYKFLVGWYSWALLDGPQHPIFAKDIGLCGCAYEYGRQFVSAPPNGGVSLLDELIDLMDDDGLDLFSPFSSGEEYWAEGVEERMHQNPRRLSWVYLKLVEYEDL